MSESFSGEQAALAQDAFIWGLPLVLMQRSFDVSARAGLPVNQFYATTELAIPEYRQIGPNIDTLMGHAWLDLSGGPQVIEMPDAGDRYCSIQLQDMYMNSFQYLSRRMFGRGDRTFVVTPPGYKGTLPDDMIQVSAPTTRILAYVRTMLRDREDLKASRSLHASYTLGALVDHPQGRSTPIARSDRARLFPHVDFTQTGASFFDELDLLVRAYPPLSWDVSNLARFAPLGIGVPGDARRRPGAQAALAAAVTAGYAIVRSSLRLTWANGWARRDNVPPFIHDPLQRAANNFFGKGTHLTAEAAYWGTYQGGMGDWLDGANRYHLHFAPGGTPPVDAFWSLTLYDRHYVLFDNPIDRHGILDRTVDLHYNDDGSLDIQIQADEPAEGRSNWLPCPAGEFQLMVRAYEPREAIMAGDYVPPPIEIVGPR